ncbi:UNVERIFIED_CONTAM: Heparanase-like protein 3 [Sesamum angustifolium]|uniref:Heparanase-like protein 3 n=1 Tax=Sesamum angustifolium TaxID=2727405 RepID=A0AAW2PQ75_9LAMI
MGSSLLQKGWCVSVCVLCFSLTSGVHADKTVDGTVFVDGKRPIAWTDENFICATLDWWPPEKCDYGNCSWGHASLLNLACVSFMHFLLLDLLMFAFSPLKIRLGGTLQDKVIYQTEDSRGPCKPFAESPSELFGYTDACLPLARWDELNSFFKEAEAVIIFGLNALHGKSIHPNYTATGPWNPSNAASFIHYTAKKGYQIYGWELGQSLDFGHISCSCQGNELCGKGIGVGVAADTYASDTIVLYNLIRDIYKGDNAKPQIIGPGGFFDSGWFEQYIAKTAGSLDAVTHHIYNLGSGRNEHLIYRILNPSVLDGGADVFKALEGILRSSGTSAAAWVGESGGAYNSGRNRVTNAFVFSFWYLDQLGLASTYNTKTYCRQSLIGGNYGLLNTTTFVPNPDYYRLKENEFLLALSLLPGLSLAANYSICSFWHKLMGRSVLLTNFTGTKRVRAYSHCAKQSKGVVLLLINLDGSTAVQAKIEAKGRLMNLHKNRHYLHNSKVSGLTREEYHLTPKDGNIQSQTVLLNGKALTVGSSGAIPALDPVTISLSKPITVAPFSIVFVHFPDVAMPACR